MLSQSQKKEDKTEEYYKLLKEFNAYKENSLMEKENMKREIQKCKSTIQRFMDKVEKKMDSKLTEERTNSNNNLQRNEKYFQKQIDSLKLVIEMKDKFIDELREMIHQLENEKKAIVETNTKMLLDINQDLQTSTMVKGTKNSHSYSQLLKMYQYLIEENNEIKKQLFLLKKEHSNSSFIQKQDKNLINVNKKNGKTMSEHNTSKNQTKSKISVIKQKQIVHKKNTIAKAGKKQVKS